MNFELRSGETVHLIGDPHLGRRFETGVPLNRRGEREAAQLVHFHDELAVECNINIMVGDLFDHPHVGYGVVLSAAQAYISAAKARPNTEFYAMAGNHDRSRNLGVVGAWEVFKRLVEGRLPNLFVVDYAGQVQTIACFPWVWGTTVTEQVEAFTGDPSEIELCVGHWDFESYGGSTDHVAPTKALLEVFGEDVKLVSGHYHLPGTYDVDGTPVVCTGSMEPYSHAEDPDGTTYVTLTLDELGEHQDLQFKCVRILLREGEELPVGLDCLALTAKRVVEEHDGPDVAEIVGAFDWKAILDECLKDVPAEVRSFIDERMQNVG